MIALGLLNLTWWKDRAWATLPPNNAFVQSLAGRRRGVLITLVIDTSACKDEEADRFHNVLVHFIGTISVTRRSDGGCWYKIALPLKVSRMLLPIKDCVKARAFLQPWQTLEKVGGVRRSLEQ